MITSVAQFIKLRTSDNPDEYCLSASEELEDHVWDDLIKVPDMRVWAAHNKTVPIRILEILADDPDSRVRATVAMKGKATPQLLSKLASDNDSGIRYIVARHRKTPRHVLEVLVNDSWDEIVDYVKKRLQDGTEDNE